MAATWPATLPQHPRRNGFSRSPRPNIVAFGTEVGKGKRRRRSTARSQLWTLQFIMTADQVEDFEAFFNDDLEDGALEFEWVYPMTGATWRFTFDTDQPWSIAPLSGVESLVSLSLEGAALP